ncbi:hypothetical protein KM043_002774 [Ampulex compressa]|nr:hypothetical protein KM043_002774 [Ampulex compressa]
MEDGSLRETLKPGLMTRNHRSAPSSMAPDLFPTGIEFSSDLFIRSRAPRPPGSPGPRPLHAASPLSSRTFAVCAYISIYHTWNPRLGDRNSQSREAAYSRSCASEYDREVFIPDGSAERRRSQAEDAEVAMQEVVEGGGGWRCEMGYRGECSVEEGGREGGRERESEGCGIDGILQSRLPTVFEFRHEPLATPAIEHLYL